MRLRMFKCLIAVRIGAHHAIVRFVSNMALIVSHNNYLLICPTFEKLSVILHIVIYYTFNYFFIWILYNNCSMLSQKNYFSQSLNEEKSDVLNLARWEDFFSFCRSEMCVNLFKQNPCRLCTNAWYICNFKDWIFEN